jgi:NADH dehydrogenase
MARPRVVIIGAGFGGLECAKALDSSSVDVLLIDRHNYHLFAPLLYQVASSLLNPSDIAYPVRRVFRGSPNVRFRQADIGEIDLNGRAVVTSEGETIGYDYLVVAIGSTSNYFGNQAVATRAFGLKNLGEALQLRNHTLRCLEEASHASDEAGQKRWMSFVIVGGGPTGVEYAGALAELMRLVLPAEYPDIRVPPRIVLVEGRDRLLAAFSPKLSRYTEERLGSLGVEVMLDRLVTEVDDDGVVLSDGARIESHCLVWSAGVKPEGTSLELPRRERSKRIEVDAYLRIEGHRDAFAIGDAAAVEQDGGELPMLSAPAMQQGRYVAKLIRDHLGRGGEELNGAPFSYVDKGTMATIGRNAAVCSIAGLELTGLLGWLAWLVVHIWYLIGFRNRLVVMWTWSWNYLRYDRPVRIITRAKARTLAEGGTASDG